MNTSELKLRGYRRNDFEAMFRLDEICFEPQFRFSRAMMRRFAEVANARVVVGEIAEQLAGFCIVHVEGRRRVKAGYVVTLDVGPEFRRAGVAKRLMEQAELEACSAGCSAMLLHVFAGNDAAIRFYEREGYQFVRMDKDFYGQGVDAMVYRKPLQLA